MDTNKEALLEVVWGICMRCANGDIPITEQAELEKLSIMLDNFKQGRFINYGLPNSLNTD